MSACLPCLAKDIQSTATRGVPIQVGVRSILTPMCTRCAAEYWKPQPSVSAISIPGVVDRDKLAAAIRASGEPRPMKSRLCACGCGHPLQLNTRLSYNYGHHPNTRGRVLEMQRKAVI